MTLLREMTAATGVPETSANRPPSEFDEALPEFSDDYTEIEYLLSGIANTYTGPITGPAHGGQPRASLCHPGFGPLSRQLARFSGRVVIEPFNTTYGVDRDALWLHVATLLQAQGDAWIGISVRAWSSEELKRRDSQRYAEVDIVSNDLVWDLLRAIGTLVKLGNQHSPLRDLPVGHVYLGGYSQSALDTATLPRPLATSTQIRLFPDLTCGKPDAARARGRPATLRVRADATGWSPGHRSPVHKATSKDSALTSSSTPAVPRCGGRTATLPGIASGFTKSRGHRRCGQDRRLRWRRLELPVGGLCPCRAAQPISLGRGRHHSADGAAHHLEIRRCGPRRPSTGSATPAAAYRHHFSRCRSPAMRHIRRRGRCCVRRPGGDPALRGACQQVRRSADLPRRIHHQAR